MDTMKFQCTLNLHISKEIHTKLHPHIEHIHIRVLMYVTTRLLLHVMKVVLSGEFRGVVPLARVSLSEGPGGSKSVCNK